MTAEPEHQPLSAEDADRAFAPLREFETILLAVSGGPDSMAMLHLAAEWARRDGRPLGSIAVATVDHQLRAESATEAGIVAERCAKVGLTHVTLYWTGQKPWSGVAQEARRARYRLLEEHALKLGDPGNTAVVTAHTIDDQAETFLMRLKRGSGVEGLAAIPANRPIEVGSKIQLFRPFLAFEKTRMIAVLQVRGATWCEDPSNADINAERVRLRRLLLTMRQSGFAAAAFARTAQRMRDATEGLDYASRLFEASLALDTHGGMFAAFPRAPFIEGPLILRQRVLTRLLGQFGGSTPDPELAEVERLAARFDKDSQFAATLGGATVSAGPRTVRIWREVARIDPKPLQLDPGASMIWDKRFRVGLAPESEGPLEVRPLGPAAHLVPELTAVLPAAAVQGLPSFWKGGSLVCLPPLLRQLEARPQQSEPCALDGTSVSVAWIY